MKVKEEKKTGEKAGRRFFKELAAKAGYIWGGIFRSVRRLFNRQPGYAEGLENIFFICPCCGGLESFEAFDDTFRCRLCGAGGFYDEYGHIDSPDFPFTDAEEWIAWEEKELDMRYDKEDLLGNYPGASLYELIGGDEAKLLLTGTVIADRDAFMTGEYVFPYIDTEDLQYDETGNVCLFSHKGHRYMISAPYLCGMKTMLLYEKRKREKI